jgi:hypothetical protein
LILVLISFGNLSKFPAAGCAFLKYETRDQAVAALEAVNGKHKMEVCLSYFQFRLLREFSSKYTDLRSGWNFYHCLVHYSGLGICNIV